MTIVKDSRGKQVFSMRMRTLEDGSILVAPIDPDTREQLGNFRQPTDEERAYINGYLGRETRTVTQMIADPRVCKINVTSDDPRVDAGEVSDALRDFLGREDVRPGEEPDQERGVPREEASSDLVDTYLRGILARDVW